MKILKYNEYMAESLKSTLQADKEAKKANSAEIDKDFEQFGSLLNEFEHFFEDNELWSKDEQETLLNNICLVAQYPDSKGDDVMNMVTCKNGTFQEVMDDETNAVEFIRYFIKKSYSKDFDGKQKKGHTIKFGLGINEAKECCKEFVESLEKELKKHGSAGDFVKVKRLSEINVNKPDAPAIPSKTKASVAFMIDSYDECMKIFDDGESKK